MTKVTTKEIAAWKDSHGTVYELTTEDGKVGYIRDPLAKLSVVKQAFAAMAKEGMIGMADTYLKNCWLGGDKAIIKEESYANGLADQIDEIAHLPDFEVIRQGNKFVLESEGMVVDVRLAKRADIITAEQKNTASMPFVTAELLLAAIALDKAQLDAVKQKTRAYLGILRAVNQVKDKTYVGIKKL